jgi:DNA integrity scanning protein DisA with diadenylate cyclase activity
LRGVIGDLVSENFLQILCVKQVFCEFYKYYIFMRKYDYARLDEVLSELDALNRYLDEAAGSHGIKTFFHEQAIKDYHAVEVDIRRFLKRLKPLNEDLYWQLKAHLKIGFQCAWVK